MKLSDHIHQTKMGRSVPPARPLSPTEKRPAPLEAPRAPAALEVRTKGAASAQGGLLLTWPASKTKQENSFRLADFIKKKFTAPAKPQAWQKSAAQADPWPSSPTRPLAAPEAQLLRAGNATHSVAGGRTAATPPVTDSLPAAPAPSPPASETSPESSFRLADFIKKKFTAPAKPQAWPKERPAAVMPQSREMAADPVTRHEREVPRGQDRRTPCGATTKPIPPITDGLQEEPMMTAPATLPPPKPAEKAVAAINDEPAVAKAMAGRLAIHPAARRAETAEPAGLPAYARAPARELGQGGFHRKFQPEGGISQFEAQPASIYEAARQLGIALPQNHHQEKIDKARSCLAMIFKKITQPSLNEKMIWPMIKSIAADLEGIIAADPNLLTILHRHRVDEERLVWHSLYTSILAMDLAQHADNLECSIHDIGGAALLHDAGRLFQTEVYAIVDDENSTDLKDHIAKGVELARKIEAPEVVATMIAQHHGRFDGRGYPPGLTGKTFSRDSQVVAIANAFECAILDITREKKEDLSEDKFKETGGNGIPHAFNNYRHAFSADLLKKMIALVGFYPVGSIIELNNRAICEVVKQNRDFPVRPVVRVILDSGRNHPENEHLIDLKQVKVLSILRNVARPKTT